MTARATALAGLLVMAAVAAAQDSIPPIAARVTVAADATQKLEVSGKTPERTGWLEVTFSPAGGQRGVSGERRSVYSVSGEFHSTFPVPSGCERGTYVVTLWRQKLADSTSAELEGLKAFGSGSVGSGPKATTLADSLAALKTGISTVDGHKVLTVSGRARVNRWLHAAFYRSVPDAPAPESSFVQLYLPKGDFSQAFAVPAGFENGGYEVSLWVKFAPRLRELRMSGELGSVSGSVGK